MKIEQFYDEGLAQASYAIVSNGEMALVDPARDPQPFFDYAKANNATIKAVFETHPHADFVSSHAEIARKTGAKIYVSKDLEPAYEHEKLEEGDIVKLGDIQFKILFTPGHSPDSISIVAIDENGEENAVFTGDTLFIGDVGRPDLREKAGNIQAKREALARQMFDTVQKHFKRMQEHIEVYPAHGAGSLCGKNLSTDLSSTIGKELDRNVSLQYKDQETFVNNLLEGQPYIPKYFIYDVELNRKGAPDYEPSVKSVPRLDKNARKDEDILVIDGRPATEFQKGHDANAINIPEDLKFETWLGSLIGGDESFYLIGQDEASLDNLIRKAAKIGYELLIQGAKVGPFAKEKAGAPLGNSEFKEKHPEDFNIVDVREKTEVALDQKFSHAINIPLNDLRERINEVPTDKPIVVHCAGGYRSSIGYSIISEHVNNETEVYDLGEEIKNVEPADSV